MKTPQTKNFRTYQITCDHPKHLNLEVEVWCDKDVDPLVRAFQVDADLRAVPLHHGKQNEFKTKFTTKMMDARKASRTE